MSATYPVNSSGPRIDQPQTETSARPVRAEVIGYTAPRGFGSVRDEERFQDIFDDDPETAPGYSYQGGGIGGRYRPPFGAPYSEQPYEDTILVLHHNKKGIRIGLQASHKMFFAIVIVVLVILNSPGIADLLNLLVKAMMSLR